jgi:hypothetical protein
MASIHFTRVPTFLLKKEGVSQRSPEGEDRGEGDSLVGAACPTCLTVLHKGLKTWEQLSDVYSKD